ncbi:MAG: fibronectin type III domain-containing protein [bacterium]
MKRTMVLGASLIMLSAVLWRNFAQSSPTVQPAKLSPPTNVRVETGENAIKVIWGASPDEASDDFAGYNVYFDTKSSALLAPAHLLNVVPVRKHIHECIVRGLENGRQYFFHVRARNIVGGVSAAGLPEQEAAPQPEGEKYAVSMCDDDVATTANNSGYGWNRENGQGIPGYRSVTQHGKYVDIVMMELPAAKSKSLFVSPSEAAFTQRWPYRNRTLIADLGTTWVIADSLPVAAFTTTAEIKNGHIYVLKTHDNYYVKLRINSIEEVNLLLRFEEPRRNTILNKITFTYASQLGQSYEHLLTGEP